MHGLTTAGEICGSLLAIAGAGKGAVGLVRWGVRLRELLEDIVTGFADLRRNDRRQDHRLDALEQRRAS